MKRSTFSAFGLGLGLGATGVVLLALACERPLSVPEALRPPSPSERFEEALRRSSLSETAMGRSWFSSGAEALTSPSAASLPLREVVFFDPARPAAFGWRFSLRRGEVLEVGVDSAGDATVRRFLDLHQVKTALSTDRSGRLPESETDLVHRSDDGSRLTWQVERDGDYVLRLRVELLTGGRFTVDARTTPRLARFPVDGAGSRDIGSRFGDPRDGGRRRHHGVDIFAERGTLVLAPEGGRVVRAGTNRLGGNVVWMQSDSGLRLYFAHLDEHLVGFGARLEAGEPVGRVGNTGNARTTPPHLHFGIYQRGPVDPWPFLYRDRGRPDPITAELEAQSRWLRVRGASANFRAGPSTGDRVLARLERGAAIRAEGARGEWFRAVSPDAGAGWAHRSVVEAADRPLASRTLDRTTLVRHAPEVNAPAIGALDSGSEVVVLARTAQAELVGLDNELTAWMVLD